MITLTQHFTRPISKTSLQEVIRRHVALSQHTSFKVGGPADYFATPRSLDELRGILAFAQAQSLRWMVLGNGTNSLFPDEGFRGVVIQLTRKYGAMRIDEDRLSAQAGASLGAAMGYLRVKGFYDFDGLVGIPASIGGALAMNAGIPEFSISERVRNVTVLAKDGALLRLNQEECNFSYRKSIFQKRDWVIVGVEFQLGAERRFDSEALLQRRRDRQPIQSPSAGCIFKNPSNGPGAGKLIDLSGLKGLKCGGAMISPLHANFIVNTGEASAQDILQLIDFAKERVYKEFSVELQLEVAVVSNANLR
jgi:UDP-N-acetylmuramate dehydrogenase